MKTQEKKQEAPKTQDTKKTPKPRTRKEGVKKRTQPQPQTQGQPFTFPSSSTGWTQTHSRNLNGNSREGQAFMQQILNSVGTAMNSRGSGVRVQDNNYFIDASSDEGKAFVDSMIEQGIITREMLSGNYRG